MGTLGKPVMRFHSYITHVLVFATRAFYDSPRGRWVFKMFLEARPRPAPRRPLLLLLG